MKRADSTWNGYKGFPDGLSPGKLIEIYTDEHGRTIGRYAPGWAMGAEPELRID